MNVCSEAKTRLASAKSHQDVSVDVPRQVKLWAIYIFRLKLQSLVLSATRKWITRMEFIYISMCTVINFHFYLFSFCIFRWPVCLRIGRVWTTNKYSHHAHSLAGTCIVSLSLFVVCNFDFYSNLFTIFFFSHEFYLHLALRVFLWISNGILIGLFFCSEFNHFPRKI